MNKFITSALSTFVGMAAGAFAVGKRTGKEIVRNRNLSEKHLALFLMMKQWVKVKQEGKSLISYFEEKGYKKIAVYGMSYAGETLLNELRESGIQAVYGIDKNAGQIYADIDIMTMEDELEEVDAVVVTAVAFFDEIEEKLSKKMSCPIISLEDILDEVYNAC